MTDRSHLTGAIHFWQTPTVEDAGRTGSAEGWRQWTEEGRTTRGPLQVVGMADRGDRGDLNTAVKGYVSKHTRWPTPKASMSDAWTMESQRLSGQQRAAMKEAGTPFASTIGGQLNPTWVEWLMGFPLGWTDLEDSGTP